MGAVTTNGDQCVEVVVNGCEHAVAMTSTLHAFADLFGCTWRAPGAIFYDESVYPIARWGMERAERLAVMAQLSARMTEAGLTPPASAATPKAG